MLVILQVYRKAGEEDESESEEDAEEDEIEVTAPAVKRTER